MDLQKKSFIEPAESFQHLLKLTLWKKLVRLVLGLVFNPIQDGGAKKAPPTSFSPVTSANIGIVPQTFLIFSYNPLATLVESFKAIPSASPKLLNFHQDQHSKKVIFLVKSF